MKKGKDETEDKVYSWVGKQMKIRITDNRILVGNGLTPVSLGNFIRLNSIFIYIIYFQTVIENFYVQIKIKI